MIVYRISREIYAHDLSGQGAQLAGGRWNSKGMAMLYTAETSSLAMLEVLVHTQKNLVPTDLMLVKIQLPNTPSIQKLSPSSLPKNWRIYPPLPLLKALGDQWLLRGEALILRVPSAVNPYESSMLVNPNHPEAQLISVLEQIPISLDGRLKG